MYGEDIDEDDVFEDDMQSLYCPFESRFYGDCEFELSDSEYLMTIKNKIDIEPFTIDFIEKITKNSFDDYSFLKQDPFINEFNGIALDDRFG
jgi:hypothetical protein